jgi:aspartate/methionine/tyrosine aminotransferase
MGRSLDTMPLSGIARIRDLMYSVENGFRLDQGDVSFPAPAAVKAAMIRAIDEDRTHYLQTTGLPALRARLAEKLRRANGIAVADPDEVMITNGGVHGLYLLARALLEPGDEVIVPDPIWPSVRSIVAAADAVPVSCPLHEALEWRYDLDELERLVTARTRAIYLNSPNNPTGGVLTRADLERIAALARDRDLHVISDEAYEDIVYEGEPVSIASLPGMYPRTLSAFTFSKSFAMTGLRLGYIAVHDEALRDRLRKLLFITASNVSSVVQYGGLGGMEESRQVAGAYRAELRARRDRFYAGIAEAAGRVLSGRPPRGAFYAFLRIAPDWRDPGSGGAVPSSLSWSFCEYLIRAARVGSVAGVDFGPQGEGYVRFCFARERSELAGALESMKAVLAK